MNREIAKRILTAYGNPIIETPKATITFSRQTTSDIEKIEKMPDDELVQNWKNLVYMNHIYGHVSLNDLQRIDLIELEIDDRKDIVQDELNDWFDKKEEEFNAK